MSGCYIDNHFCDCENCEYYGCVIRFSEFTEEEGEYDYGFLENNK